MFTVYSPEFFWNSVQAGSRNAVTFNCLLFFAVVLLFRGLSKDPVLSAVSIFLNRALSFFIIILLSVDFCWTPFTVFKKHQGHAILCWESCIQCTVCVGGCRMFCSVWWYAEHTLFSCSALLSIMLSRYSTLTFDIWIFIWHLTQKESDLINTVCWCSYSFSTARILLAFLKKSLFLPLITSKHTPTCVVCDLPLRSVWHIFNT